MMTDFTTEARHTIGRTTLTTTLTLFRKGLESIESLPLGRHLMHDHKPSATAWRVALARAAHQLIDPPVIFHDPVAERLVGEAAVAKFIAEHKNYSKMRHAFSRGLRAFVCARSQLAEERLAAAVAKGIRQYVVLGAGLDTFAYRNPFENAAPALRVFEVDHPATQSWKQDLLSAATIPIPPTLTYVPVDFEKQDLAEQLAAVGFDPVQPAFFAWLGVVPYLTLDAFRRTAHFIARLPPTTEVLFDYAAAGPDTGFLERTAYHLFALKLAAIGEPIRLRMTADEMHHHLLAAGFHHLEDWTATDLHTRYFANRTDHLALSGRLGRIISATV